MSEILQTLGFNAQADGNAETQSPVVDMRDADILGSVANMRGSNAASDISDQDLSLLPTATIDEDHIDLGEKPQIARLSIGRDEDSDRDFTVKDLLKHLLDFPGPVDGVVPDSWGHSSRSEFKHVSPLVDSVYALDHAAKHLLDDMRQDFLEIRKNRQV